MIVRGKEYRLPAWWSGAGFTAKAGWLCARTGIGYTEACAALRGRRQVRRVLSAQEVYALNERRGLA